MSGYGICHSPCCEPGPELEERVGCAHCGADIPIDDAYQMFFPGGQSEWYCSTAECREGGIDTWKETYDVVLCSTYIRFLTKKRQNHSPRGEQMYYLTDGTEVAQAARMSKAEAAEMNEKAREVTAGNWWWGTGELPLEDDHGVLLAVMGGQQ